jgi:hypothetical protein
MQPSQRIIFLGGIAAAMWPVCGRGATTARPKVPSLAQLQNGRAAGAVAGRRFVVEGAEAVLITDAVGMVGKGPKACQYHLTLREGKDFFADREFKIFITLKPGQTLDGRSYFVRPVEFNSDAWQADKDRSGTFNGAVLGVSGVHMSAIPSGSDMPKTEMFMDRFSLRLQFGKSAAGKIPGQIDLRVPDKARSWVIGRFAATLKKLR